MKVICRGVVTGMKGIPCDPKCCHHSKPHEPYDVCGMFPYDEFHNDCDCIPLPLEILMKEILNEGGDKEWKKKD